MTFRPTHEPSTHDEPAEQTVPQLPQFFGSDCVLRQTPPQRVWVAVHGVSGAHVPAVQALFAPTGPQRVPSAAFGFAHVPVLGLQAPAT
jgi:hypothetical protein